MSTTLQNSKNIQIELKIQQGIRQAEDDLVNRIEDALNNTNYMKNGNDKLEESQFRNVVRVADTTESAAVIKNFLLYQVGRTNKAGQSKWGQKEGSLAYRIIKDIDDLLTKAKAIATQAETKEVNRIYLDLIRRYLGYGARYLKFLNDGK